MKRPAGRPRFHAHPASTSPRGAPNGPPRGAIYVRLAWSNFCFCAETTAYPSSSHGLDEMSLFSGGLLLAAPQAKVNFPAGVYLAYCPAPLAYDAWIALLDGSGYQACSGHKVPALSAAGVMILWVFNARQWCLYAAGLALSSEFFLLRKPFYQYLGVVYRV